MVAPDDTEKALVDLERAASEVARATWSGRGVPIPAYPTIDHIDGSISVRFRRSGAGSPESGGTGYDDDILEVWLDPAGKTLAVDAYRHFTCIAAGTPVATPGGPIPVERLSVGSEVVALDPATGERSVAIVVRSDRSHAESVRRVGALRVTAEHPVWADGRWTRAGELPDSARLIGLDGKPLVAVSASDEGAATVYDLTVTAPHTFFAGGVLVHNKAQHVPLGPAGPWGPLFHRRAAKP